MSEKYTGLECEKDGAIARVFLNRPEKRNAMEIDLWQALYDTFRDLDRDRDIRVVILAGRGKSFCGGLDLKGLGQLPSFDMNNQTPRNRMDFATYIRDWQEALTVIERCRKPVIAAVHDCCVGGGLDLIAACDIRICSADAYFSLREAAVGIVADLGSLQRLPLIIGQGLTRELAFTARNVGAEEAQRMHLVNHVYPDQETLMKEADVLAKQISEQSPLAVQSSKEVLNYGRNMNVEDGLHYAVIRNSMILPSDDLMEAFQAFMEKRKPKF